MSMLITGGAGYIGSHMVYAALDRGDDVVVLDNLSTGIHALVAKRATFVEGDVGDQALVRNLINDFGVTSVVHFAGSLIVPESVEKPLLYYKNNCIASRNLIETCIETGVIDFVFSSTAAVYGTPDVNPVSEEVILRPISPYGHSKLMVEWMLEDVSNAHDFSYVALRYFNVAGADPKGRTGQSTPQATHLIKRACQVALGHIPYLEIFGTDFPTRDGTAIRDYIHVTDLIEAHLLALDHLETGGRSLSLNCGYGHGFSVREVIDTVSNVAGRKLKTREAPRRAGDPPEIVANAMRLKSQFGWQPSHNDLRDIVATAYAWESSRNFV